MSIVTTRSTRIWHEIAALFNRYDGSLGPVVKDERIRS